VESFALMHVQQCESLCNSDTEVASNYLNNLL
jgi:hypothetical protein